MVENNKKKVVKKKIAKKKAPAKLSKKKTIKKSTKSVKKKEKIKNITKELKSLISEEIEDLKEWANRNVISEEEENKFINSITSTFKKAKEEVQIFVKNRKLDMEISSIKRNLPLKYQKLGEKIYQLIEDKKISISEVDSMIDGINTTYGKISAMEKKIQDLKKAAKTI